MPKICRAAVLASLLYALPACSLAQAAEESATLGIQLQKPIAKVSPTLYGLMTEEINYSYDGGLYAELVRNRTFQDDEFLNDSHDPAHWTLVEKGTTDASMSEDKATGPSAALTKSLRLTVTKADAANPAGVENEGYWGIPVRADTTYTGSFYAKADTAFAGPVTVSLVNDNTGVASATATVPALGSDWKEYHVTLHTAGGLETSAANHSC